MKKNAVIILALFLGFNAYAQQADGPVNKLWHLEAYAKKGGNSGIGLAEALEMVKGKTPTTVVVAIADAGVDIEHPDLKNMLWTNPGEIADNGKDDDGNGYIDDVYGWNFIGETIYDNLEITRQYKILNAKYELKSNTELTDNAEFARYLKIKAAYLEAQQTAEQSFKFFEQITNGIASLEDTYGEDMTKEELDAHKPKGKDEVAAIGVLKRNTERSGTLNLSAIKGSIKGAYDYYESGYKYYYNTDFTPRAEAVGDNYEDPNERIYGSNNVYYGDHSSHGTHVAGIVAADAGNDFGAEGICQSCEIMSIRNVPEGDERDKDVANAIRYAVDNGAKIVNMSFGKGYAHNTEIVREAIKYAEAKGVLLVHAAGNSNQNNDETDNFPNDNGDATNNWIEVGAASWEAKPEAFASFSNYGSEEIDIWAPGVDIFATYPENEYNAISGTSMASPVVAGVAGFVWSYYPDFTAAEIKQILLDSALPIKGRSAKPGSKKKTRACKISRTGGEVNLPAALRLAEARSKK